LLPSPTQGFLPFATDTPGQAAGLHGLADALRRRALPAEAGVWDELRGADGELRPAWQRFADGHTWVGWRDALDPHLTTLLGYLCKFLTQSWMLCDHFGEQRLA
jgi:hypothetical protein